MSDLSVLTLVKNRTTHLERLIEGLGRSEVAPGELVIVDMSDEPIGLSCRPAFPVTLIRLMTDGLPLAQARNLAARHAVGPRLLFLDVDCIPMKGLVDGMSEALATTDAVICSEVQYLGAGDVEDGWTEAGLLSRSMRHPVREFPPSGQRIESNVGLFWSLTFGIRRATFMAVGGFDEGFTGYGAEDTDFGFRCQEAGLPLIFLSGAGSFHQHHGVYDPPLQHFEDIVANARRFKTRWGFWPMDGWLQAFADRRLLAIDAEDLTVLRRPTPEEISGALQDGDARF